MGVRKIGTRSFPKVVGAPSDVEFGDRLETIGINAFGDCRSLKSIKIPSFRTVHLFAFACCSQLTKVELGSNLERIDNKSFYNCLSLQRIAIPLKDNLFPFETDYQCK